MSNPDGRAYVCVKKKKKKKIKCLGYTYADDIFQEGRVKKE